MVGAVLVTICGYNYYILLNEDDERTCYRATIHGDNKARSERHDMYNSVQYISKPSQHVSGRHIAIICQDLKKDHNPGG